MAWYIYSSEALPNPELMGKPGYAPDGEYIRCAGMTLPPLPKAQWLKLQETFRTRTHSSWVDRAGSDIEIPISRFKGVVDGQFSKRGVILLDHEPTAAEKKSLEAVSQELNMEWRKEVIDGYEQQVRDRETTGHGRTRPTPYEDECYELLGIPKPYSVDAFKAQRMPGAEAADRIAAAIASAMERVVGQQQQAPPVAPK